MLSSSPFVISFTLLLSLPIVFLLVPHILPPRHLPVSFPDDPDDLDLLRRASLESVHSPSSYPSSKSRLGTINPKPKIAFLFLTNTDLHFSPLWERFFKKSQNLYNIYVHADPFSPLTNPPGGVFKDRFIPAKRTYRGSPTLISAARRLLANALLDDPSNAFFALLSQQCIPLHSFKYVYHSLLASPPLKPTSPESRSELSQLGKRVKYKSFIEILSESPKLWERYTARGRYTMMPEVPFEKFRVGSQFFVLTRRHALLVTRDHRLWRKFRLPCSKTESCYPEEHYFPTLLSMEDPDGCNHYTLTRVNWTGTTHGHPHTYRPAEVSPKLIYKLRESNSTYSYLFARKFSPDCLTPLMDMSDNVIFRD